MRKRWKRTIQRVLFSKIMWMSRWSCDDMMIEHPLPSGGSILRYTPT